MAANLGMNPEFVASERLAIIQKLAVKYKIRPNKAEPGSQPPSAEESILLHRLNLFLTRLDDEVSMTPDFRKKTKIDEGMKIIFDHPEVYKFPQEYVDKASALYGKWESENWGAPVVIKRNHDLENQSDAEMSDGLSDSERGRRGSSPRKKTKTNVANGEASASQVLKQPDPNHPIWGVDGIMHGLCKAVNTDTRRESTVINPRYKHLKRECDKFGANGLEVGAWFPVQLTANFKGAHGHPMAGISGSQNDGAYSVVVSGMYDELDEDHGDYLYYSGSGSIENDDPREAPQTAGTKALHMSYQTHRPVRVLRSGSGKTRYSPACGLRYDGLYLVVAVNNRKNAKGGMFEQFKLVREADQPPIDISRPSPREQRHFNKRNEKYWAVR